MNRRHSFNRNGFTSAAKVLFAVTLVAPMAWMPSAMAQGGGPPSISKRGVDPAPVRRAPTYDEVFVISAPKRATEFRTVKEAYAHVKSGGIIYIMEKNSDIANSNSGAGLTIDRSVTIAHDADLMTEIDKSNKSHTAKAVLNAAADGSCFIVKQDSPGGNAGSRTVRNEVTFRDITFVPNPGSTARTCLDIHDGTVFLDNVEIKSGRKTFDTGVVVHGGDVTTIKKFSATVENKGLVVHGGSLTINEGLSLTFKGSAVTTTSANKCEQHALPQHSVGIYAGRSHDARKGDPKISISGANISGFDYGVCAAGDGAIVTKSTVSNSMIGIRTEGAFDLTASSIKGSSVAGIVTFKGAGKFSSNKIFENTIGALVMSGATPEIIQNMLYGNSDTGLIIGSSSGQYLENKIFNNYRGILLEKDAPLRAPKPLDVSANIVAFNGYGISHSNTGSIKYIRDFVQHFSGNEVSCNIEYGNVAKFSRFKKTNRRKKNGESCCDGSRRIRYCDDLRDLLKLRVGQCAAGWRP